MLTCSRSALVLLPIVAAQVLLLVLPLILLQPFDGSAGAYVEALPIVVGAAFAGALIGLLISAAVRTPGQAAAAVPLVMIPQLLLAGAMVPHGSLPAPLQLLSDGMVSRWALSGVGQAFDLGQRVAGDLGIITGLDPGFFGLNPAAALLILVGASVGLFVLAALALGWRLGDDSPGRVLHD